MDIRTLADWIGADAGEYDLPAAADALDEAGVTDLDADPARSLEIIAQHQRPEELDEVTAFAREVWALAGDGGTRDGVTVSPAEPREDGWRHARVSHPGMEPMWVWVHPEKPCPDAAAALEAVEGAAAEAATRARDLAAATDAADREFQRVRREYEAARRRRAAAMRAEREGGASVYAIAKRLGMSQTAAGRIISGK